METNSFDEQTSLPAIQLECLNQDERCPLCRRDNGCRMGKGHLYKGPCWCEEIIVPSQVLRALAADRLEPACLCRFCLEKAARLSRELDDPVAVVNKIREELESSPLADHEEDYYVDKDGMVVFTAAYHLRRGTCCGHGCRHCPY
jgi:hypothetical protein